MEEVDWSALHKILSDTTRRSIVELLAENEELSYTDMMSLLRITNTGRLNYHLKALGILLSKDDQGKYHLTERGKLAASMLKNFPERAHAEKNPETLKTVTTTLVILLGVSLIFSGFLFAIETPVYVGVSAGETFNFPNQPIAQNSTIFLAELTAQNNDSQFSLAGTPSNPISIFILNSTQNDALMQQYQYSGHAFLPNFTGMPPTYIYTYVLQNDSVSMTLPQGHYLLYAGFTNSTTLDSLSLTQQNSQPNLLNALPVEIISVSIGVCGIVLIAVAILIDKHRVWR